MKDITDYLYESMINDIQENNNIHVLPCLV